MNTQYIIFAFLSDSLNREVSGTFSASVAFVQIQSKSLNNGIEMQEGRSFRHDRHDQRMCAFVILSMRTF